ncbi:MAG: hypothetical protein A2252_09100 [Elusimicrobia bacterium RIFOXYA2_FULL_39_19]|nr:MAG: hypothetical protein A2252_09100 [Elusimicrobia bacterium RIFOXYA2_FULL_39_19]
MGVDIYRVSYKNVYDHVTEEEISFIENCFSLNETGSYYVSKDSLSQALIRAKEKRIKVPRELVTRLKKELKTADDSFDIQIF